MFFVFTNHAPHLIAWILVTLLAACHATLSREPTAQEVARAEALRHKSYESLQPFQPHQPAHA